MPAVLVSILVLAGGGVISFFAKSVAANGMVPNKSYCEPYTFKTTGMLYVDVDGYTSNSPVIVAATWWDSNDTTVNFVNFENTDTEETFDADHVVKDTNYSVRPNIATKVFLAQDIAYMSFAVNLSGEANLRICYFNFPDALYSDFVSGTYEEYGTNVSHSETSPAYDVASVLIASVYADSSTVSPGANTQLDFEETAHSLTLAVATSDSPLEDDTNIDVSFSTNIAAVAYDFQVVVPSLDVGEYELYLNEEWDEDTEEYVVESAELYVEGYAYLYDEGSPCGTNCRNLSDLVYYINKDGEEYIPGYSSINHNFPYEEFSINFGGLEPGYYEMGFYVYDTGGWETDYHEIEFTVGEAEEPGSLKVSANEAQVEGDDVTITGEVTSQGGDFWVSQIYYYINFGGLTYMPAVDGAYDETTEEFELYLEDLEAGHYTIEFYAAETDGNTTNNTEGDGPVIIEFDIEEQSDPGAPEINVTEGPLDPYSSYIRVEGYVFDVDGDIITRIYYTVDGGSEVDIDPVDGVFDEAVEEFVIENVGPYQNGTEVDFIIRVDNDIDETGVATYNNLKVFNDSDFADCELSNHANPTSDNTPTHTITCTSVDNITNLHYRVFSETEGMLVDWTEIPPEDLTSGSYGETTIAASITQGVALPDGNNSIAVSATTGTGRFHSNDTTFFSFVPPAPIDVFVVEAIDESTPTIKLNPILPNPITSTAPYITGSCQDVHPFDTNSTIETLQYRLDGGSWVDIDPLNAPLDNAIEDFSFQLPEQEIGEHTLDVRCIDAAGFDTNNDDTNASLTFEIIVQPDVEPEEVVITEDFTSNALNSVNETTAIWGNGYIRLKERILFEKELLDSTGFVGRYDYVFSAQFPLKGTEDGSNHNIWYAFDEANGGQGIKRYHTESEAITEYADVSNFRINDFEYFSSGGNAYLLFTDPEGLHLRNLTLNVTMDITAGGASDFIPAEITRDPRNANFGFYVGNTELNTDEQANTYYIDLNGTPSNLGDDTVTWYEGTFALPRTNINHVLLDDANNILYATQFGGSLYRIDDNGTPSNLADDTTTEFDTGHFIGLDKASGLVKDPNDDGIFIITHSNVSNLLYLDVNGTVGNPADDEIVLLSNEFDLFQQRVDNLVFVEGPEYVGGQLFMMTRTGRLLYYNTNGTYASNTDDTTILLETNEGLYPEYISDIYFADYNTIYATFQHTGMTRIDLNRTWEQTNDAVTISVPPNVRLVVNNINLEEVILGPLLEDFDGSTVANNNGVGVQYFISLNDGITYQEVSIGELAQILEEDYRLKLKITLTKIGENSQTPIIEGFTIAYAAYTEVPEPDSGTLVVTPSATSFTTAQQFTLNFRVEDELGYVIPTYNGTLDLELQNFADNTPAAGFSHTTVNIVDGVATINNAQISQAGEYRIVATNADYTANTVQLTVTNPPVDEPEPPQPSISFYANRYSILPGEEATITWATENLTNVTLTPGGSVDTDGSQVVSPEQTTYYVLSGTTTSDNTMSAGLTITVLGTGDEGCVEENPEDCEVVCPDETLEDCEPTVGELGLTVTPQTVTVQKGGKVEISWVATNADDVFIDYTNSTGSPIGSFEFFPEQDVVVTITARRGEESVSQQVQIFVVEDEFVNGGGGALSISAPTVPGIAAIASLFAVAVLNGGLANYTAIFFGLLIWRKRKYWGVVFDASTFKPLALATVRIYRKTQTGRVFVAQTVTDLEGRYGINISDAGSYTVEFVREGYASLLREITISRNEDVILDVGMREVNEIEGAFGGIRYFWKQNAVGIMQILRVAVVILMTWGLSLALQAIAQDASFANYLVAGLYLIVLLLQIVIILEPYFGRKSGAVVDSESRRPLHGAVVRLLNVENNGQSVEDVGISNQSGIIKIRVKKGSYNYMASRSGYETSQGNATIDAGGKLTKLIGLNRAAPGQTTKFGT